MGRTRRVNGFTAYLDSEVFDVAILEGPTEVKWAYLEQWAGSVGRSCTLQEFVTSELGEAMVRRRVAGFVFLVEKTREAVEFLMVKSVTPPAMGSYLRKFEEGNCVPVEKYENAVNVSQEVMLPVVTAHAWIKEDGDRQNP